MSCPCVENGGLVFDPGCHLRDDFRLRCMTFCPGCQPGRVTGQCPHRRFGGGQ